MRRNSETSKRGINSRLLVEGDSAIKDVLKKLDEAHGVGIVTQDETGGHVAIRVNRSTKRLEAFIDKKWVSIGS